MAVDNESPPSPPIVSAPRVRPARGRSGTNIIADIVHYGENRVKEHQERVNVAQHTADKEADTNHDEADLDILVSTYAEQRKDYSLNAVWDTLKESRATPADFLRFVKKIVATVYPILSSTSEKSRSVPIAAMDLRSLPANAYATIMANIGDLLRDEVDSQAPQNDSKPLQWKLWMDDAVRFLLADSPYPLPAATSSTLVKVMDPSRAEHFCDVVVRSLSASSNNGMITEDEFMYIFNRLHGALNLIANETLLSFLLILFRRCFCHHEVPNSEHGHKLVPILRDHNGDIPAACLKALGDLLLKRLSDDVFPSMFWHAHLCDMLIILLNILDGLPSGSLARNDLHDKLVTFSRTLLIQERNTAIFARFASGILENNEIIIRSASELFVDALVESAVPDRFEILSNLKAALVWQSEHTETEANEWDEYVRLGLLKTCLTVMKAIGEMKKRDCLPPRGSESEQVLKDSLSGLWHTISDNLRRPSHDESDDTLRKRCLELITLIEGLSFAEEASEEVFTVWAQDFNVEASFFTDELIETLCGALPASLSITFPRVRRIRVLKPTTPSAESSKDDSPAGGDVSSVKSSKD